MLLKVRKKCFPFKVACVMSCLFYEWISDGSSEETDNDGSVLSNETTSTVSLPIIYPVIIRGAVYNEMGEVMGKWRVK